MGRTAILTYLTLVLILAAGGCRQTDAPEGTAEIAVTNSYLESAVRDLWGGDVEILSLAPTGACPGHFDISPGQVRQLQSCTLLLLFEFQQQVRDRLTRLEEDGLGVRLVRTEPGLCLPETYLDTCREVAGLLASEYPDRAATFERRLAAVQERIDRLADDLQETVAKSEAEAAQILVSNHQARFAEWLGLQPVATFVGSDLETVAHIDHCLRQAAGEDVRFIVANLQEGTGLAKALADRLGAEAVVFSNFPPAVDGVPGFDRLVRDNVQALVEAATR